MAISLVSELKPGAIVDAEEYSFFLKGGDAIADRKS